MGMISARAVFRPRSDAGRFVDAVITPAVRASVEASCALIEQTAKIYCPVDTGRLRDSITTTIDDQGTTIKGSVSTDVSYAVYQEFGTYKMAAQPFMRPAMDECKPVIADLFRSQITVAIGK